MGYFTYSFLSSLSLSFSFFLLVSSSGEKVQSSLYLNTSGMSLWFLCVYVFVKRSRVC